MKWWEIIIKWFDRLGDWFGNVSVDLKRKKAVNAIKNLETAIADNDDKFIDDELQKLTERIENRKKLS